MKIAITGATGFLGSKLIQSLSERYEIQALSRRPITEQYTSIKYKKY
jgi:nucleoside-diphosphate-sugar epimerase